MKNKLLLTTPRFVLLFGLILPFIIFFTTSNSFASNSFASSSSESGPFASESPVSKPKIVVSSVPLAGIIQMIAASEFEIVAINIQSGCSHHYHAKPSDKFNIKKSDIAIYIDDNFDGFFAYMLDDYAGDIFKISDIKKIKFKGASGITNWHFWLDTANVNYVLEEFARFLQNKYPEIKQKIETNLSDAKHKINILSLQKRNILSDLPELILLSSSVEHFFKKDVIQYVHLFANNQLAHDNNQSLQFVQKLDKILSTKEEQCIIVDSNQNKTSFEKFGKPVVQLNAENWHVTNNLGYATYANSFFKYYQMMIDQIKKCKK